MAKTYRVKLEFEADGIKGGQGVGDDTKRKGGGASAAGGAAIGGAIGAGTAAAAAGAGAASAGAASAAVAGGIAYGVAGGMGGQTLSGTAGAGGGGGGTDIVKRPVMEIDYDTEKVKKSFTKFSKNIKSIFGKFGKTFSNIFRKFGKIFGGFGKAIKKIWKFALILSAALYGLASKLSKWSAATAKVFLKHQVHLQHFAVKLGNSMAPLFEGFFEVIEALTEVFDELGPVWKFLGAVLSGLARIITLLVNVLKPILWVLGKILDLFTWVGGLLGKVWDAIGDVFNSIGDWIKSLFGIEDDEEKGVGFDFFNAMKDYLVSKKLITDKGEPRNPKAFGGGASGPVGKTGAAGPGGPERPEIEPTAVPPAQQNVYMGMNSTCNSRKGIEESMQAFKNLMLQDYNKAENQMNLWMSELKSLNYIRMV
ncbi:MAG: hypothetical protein KOO65_08530 [Desulfobacterales bacterium]|nr:hypothetical protein [Desulfobacterales bacterium]